MNTESTSGAFSPEGIRSETKAQIRELLTNGGYIDPQTQKVSSKVTDLLASIGCALSPQTMESTDPIVISDAIAHIIKE